MDKIWNNLNKLTLRIYIFLFLLSIVCLLMMYGFVSLLSTYYAAGKRAGRREGRGRLGGGDVLPIFISSCLFGCALGFYFSLWLEITVKM